MWVGCINGDKDSWHEIKKYNVEDVLLTEKVYMELLPWIEGHANHGLLTDGAVPVCPNCGSDKLHKRGFHHTLASVFQRYRCVDCGHWSKDNKVLNRKQFKTTSIV